MTKCKSELCSLIGCKKKFSMKIIDEDVFRQVCETLVAYADNNECPNPNFIDEKCPHCRTIEIAREYLK